jgi:MFS family permease
MSFMMGTRNSFGFFFKIVSSEFGWARAQTAGAFSIGMLVQSLCSPLFGSLGERWSLRWMMAIGVLFSGASLLIGFSIHSLAQFYLMYALLNVGFASSTFVPQVQIVSNWFIKRRGLAMGITNSGQGFAAILNLAIPFLIDILGWRMSYLVLASVMVILLFPLAALLLRDRPSDRDTVADAPFLNPGERDSMTESPYRSTCPAGKAVPVAAAFSQRIFSLRFFLIAFTYGSIAFFLAGTIVHIIPHAMDQGFSAKKSAFIFLIWGVCVIAGNLISGVSDALGRAPTYAVGTVMGILACVLLAYFTEGMPPILFYLGAASSGIGIGFARPTASAILADQFAGPGFGKLNGFVMMIFALSGALGSFVTGYLFDLTGNYFGAFLLLAAFFLAGAATAIPLSKMGRPRINR